MSRTGSQASNQLGRPLSLGLNFDLNFEYEHDVVHLDYVSGKQKIIKNSLTHSYLMKA